jgi:hypothetical protein
VRQAADCLPPLVASTPTRVSVKGCARRLAPVLFLFGSLACAAQTIEGTVLNGTTGRPEPRHEVILYTASGEQARTTTDEAGTFRIEPAANQSSSSLAILKVIHDRVEYFERVAPGRRANVKVYDASSQVTGISCYLSMLQFQVKDRMLQVTELHALNNASSPPISRVSADNLVLSIPEGAVVQPAIVSGPDGGTVKVPLTPVRGKHGQYSVDFPLKPGLTKYAITYQVSYKDKFLFWRRSQYPVRRVGVVIPESMRFRALEPDVFHLVVDQPGTQEQVLDGLSTNELLAFELSGIGQLSQSFRSLNPGRSSEIGVQAEAARMMAASWPLSGSSAKPLSTSHVHTNSSTVWLTLGTVILAVAGILLWVMLHKSSLGA